MDLETFRALVIALGLGLLVGLQRERVASEVAGIRTFALITLLGAVAGLVGRDGNMLFVASVALALAAFVVLGNVPRIVAREGHAGITTEVAALLMFAVGVALSFGYLGEAVTVGGVVALLLHWKSPLHALVRGLETQELQAVMRLALLGLVILPVLPNRTYGPFQVLNPFEIWLMVVLIVGISLAAYVGYRILGPEAGSVAAGLLGGLISSTALAVSYARRAGDSPATTATATVAVMVASTVVFARVLVEIAVIAPGVLPAVAAPLAIMGIVMAAVSAVVYGLAGKRLAAAEPDEEPPADLRSAILFGLLYAGIILAVAVAKARYGQAGLYVVSGLSGLTDMDAITLSTANLVRSGRVEASLGWRLLLVGAMSNMLFKAGAIGILGTRRLFLSVALSFGVAIATGVLLLLLWPG